MFDHVLPPLPEPGTPDEFVFKTPTPARSVAACPSSWASGCRARHVPFGDAKHAPALPETAGQYNLAQYEASQLPLPTIPGSHQRFRRQDSSRVAEASREVLDSDAIWTTRSSSSICNSWVALSPNNVQARG